MANLLNNQTTQFNQAPNSLGLNIAGQAISIAVNLGVGYVFNKQNQKKNKELEQQLLSLEQNQITELKNKLSAVSSEIQKTDILYQYLNEVKIENQKKQLNKKRYIFFGLVGVGSVILLLLANHLKKEN